MSPQRAAAAVGGPVIIGGDDLTDHGSISGTTLQNGWLYIRKALENIAPNVTRANDNSVAAIGSAPSTATSSDAGAAIGNAASQAGLTVTYYEGATAINGFFTALAAGTAKPKIIWIAGTDARNDLDSTEIPALNAHATQLADFVNSGGGLMSHGLEYGWLFALLPGLTTVNGGAGSNDLQLTAAGTAAFPGVTNANIGAGPWHNHFEGNFGGLQILATSKSVLDSNTDEPAAVLIGGAAVTLPTAITLTPASATNPVGTSHTVTATVRDQAGAPLAGRTVTFTVTGGPNAGATGTAVTNASGQASFTYTSNGTTGTDTITASFFDPSETKRTDTATKTWTAATTPDARAVVNATSPSCGQAVINATGVTPGLPHQIVVTPSAGGTSQIVNVTAAADQKVSATVTTGGGTFNVFVRNASNQVTVSNTAILTVAACAVATPTPTPTPSPARPTPAPTPTPTPTPAPIAVLPSTATGGDSGLPIAALAAIAIALAAFALRKRDSRT